MAFDILAFKEDFSNNHGGQHDCLFEITIPLASGLSAVGTAVNTTGFSTVNNLLIMACEASNLPGMQLATSGVNRYGYGPIEQKPFMPLFSTCDVRLLADGQGQIWNYMQSWLNFILNFNVSQGIGTATGYGATGGLGGSASNSQNPYELNYMTSYAVDITITLFQPDATQSMALVLRNAYPKFLGDPQLNWGSMNNLMRLPVSFSFTDWFNQASSTLNGFSTINTPTTTQGIGINQTN